MLLPVCNRENETNRNFFRLCEQSLKEFLRGIAGGVRFLVNGEDRDERSRSLDDVEAREFSRYDAERRVRWFDHRVCSSRINRGTEIRASQPLRALGSSLIRLRAERRDVIA